MKGITDLALRIAAPLPHPEAFDRFLFLGPHPDDIEIGAGATVARLAAMGKKICFLICTDGRYGDANVLPGTDLASLRRSEALLSAKDLGVMDVRFLNLSDGGYYSNEELLQGIARVIGDFKPQVIFAPDPDVRSECHPDHKNVGQAAKHLACMAPYPGVMAALNSAAAPVEALALYMTASPNRYVRTSPALLQQQLEAIFSRHLSQYPEGCGDAGAITLYLRLRSADFGLRCFCPAAEGFRVLGKTHMHCLPEAGK